MIPRLIDSSLRHAVLIGVLLIAAVVPARADEIPAGTVLHVRLRQLVSSFGSRQGAAVSALLIAPIEAGGRTLLPLRSELLGHVEAVRRVGLGLSRERAYIDMRFETLRIPGGADVPIDTRVAEIDDARETVDENGRIHGIRATASFSTVLSSLAVSAGVLDPMLLGFTVSTSLAVFRIPESEVILPAGAEFRLRLLEPLTVEGDYGPIAPPLATGLERASDLRTFVAGLPFRTATAGTNTPSDLTNLLFLGSRDAIVKAFDAAGWGATDPLSSRSTYAALRAVVENQGYREAPMSTLTLNGAVPAFTFAKTLDTFFKRHHLRIFGELGQYDSLAVWTASSTHDSGIGFSTRGRSFIHVIDQHIDEERDKVVRDLVLTGCVDAMSLVDRPAVPRDAMNATGDALLTDGRIAVVRLNGCESPARADQPVSADHAVRATATGSERTFRNVSLWVKNDAFRGNLFYQGYAATRMGLGALSRRPPDAPERTIRYAGEEFKIVPGARAPQHPLAPDDNPDDRRPSFYPVNQPRRTPVSFLEFSLSGGYSAFGNDTFSTQQVTLPLPLDDPSSLSLSYVARLRPGPGIHARATFNGSRRLSHEVGYSYNRAEFVSSLVSPVDAPVDNTAPAHIRQFDYNLVVQFRPNGSRIRPFASAGPGMQIIRIVDQPSNPSRPNRLARSFRDLGLIEGAWNFGSLPPLEGGGIFQLTLQCGAGVTVHLTPHLLLRGDLRGTLSEQPDFFTKSYPSLREAQIEPGPLVLGGPLRHYVFSTGIGVAF